MGRTPGGGVTFKRNKTTKLGCNFYEKRRQKHKQKKRKGETLKSDGMSIL